MLSQYNRDEVGKLILRLTLGLLMLFHGYAKITSSGSMDWIANTLTSSGLPGILAYGVYIGEILAPLMIIAGIYCRLGGWIIFVNMLFAIGLAHMGEILAMGQSGGWALELQGFYLATGLVVALIGSGNFAVRPD